MTGEIILFLGLVSGSVSSGPLHGIGAHLSRRDLVGGLFNGDSLTHAGSREGVLAKRYRLVVFMMPEGSKLHLLDCLIALRHGESCFPFWECHC